MTAERELKGASSLHLISRRNHLATLLVGLLASGSCLAQPPEPALRSVRVNGVVLHYVDKGHGPAVVFVHDAMEDYRAWQAQFAPLAKHFRLIAYSRRYNYPNHSAIRSDNHSAIVDADDLAALIRKLKVGPVRVVGHSYGAYTSIFLALRHPELVRSLVLSEPPIMIWLQDTPQGRPLLDDLMNHMWLPCAVAFPQQQPEKALQDWFGSHEFRRGGHSTSYADCLRTPGISLCRTSANGRLSPPHEMPSLLSRAIRHAKSTSRFCCSATAAPSPH